MDDKTQITYEQVRSGANTIKDCSTNLRGIFNDFEGSMKNVASPDVFEGDASETAEEKFNKLKTRFNDFTDLVNEFSETLLGAAEATEKTERNINQDASGLAN